MARRAGERQALPPELGELEDAGDLLHLFRAQMERGLRRASGLRAGHADSR